MESVDKDPNEKISDANTVLVESFSNKMLADFIDLLEELVGIEALKRLPSYLRKNAVFIINFILFGLFIYFTVTSYFNGIQQDYISLDTSGGECARVPRAATGRFMLSDDGFWEGSKPFIYSRSLIAIELNNFVAMPSEYRLYLLQLGWLLYQWVSVHSVHQQLAWNLLLLMEQRNVMDLQGYSQFVTFTADPSAVFTTEAVYAAVASRDAGPCSVVSYPDFSRSEAVLTASFDRQLMLSLCNQTVSLGNLIANSSSVDISSTFIVDMYSFSSVAAINMGFADRSNLEEVSYSELLQPFVEFEYVTRNKTYVLRQLVNPLHRGMDPVYCVEDSKTGEFLVCLLRRGYAFYLPLFNHMGSAYASVYGYPDSCNCSNGVGQSAYCQSEDLLVSLLFYRQYFADLSSFYYNIYPLIDLLLTYNDTYFDSRDKRLFYKQLVSDSYPASVYTIRGDNTRAATTFLEPDEQYDFSKAFDFCGFDCTMLTVRFWDVGSVTISPFGYNLLNGSCSPILDLSHWEDIINTPPVPLEEPYYKCTQRPLVSFYNALGISTGLISLLLTVITILLLPAIAVHMRRQHLEVMLLQKEEGDIEFGVGSSDPDYYSDKSSGCEHGKQEVIREIFSNSKCLQYEATVDLTKAAEVNATEMVIDPAPDMPDAPSIDLDSTLSIFVRNLHSAREELAKGDAFDDTNPMHTIAFHLFKRK